VDCQSTIHNSRRSLRFGEGERSRRIGRQILCLSASAVSLLTGDTLRCLKLTVEYDGTDFVGWQSQQNGRSVQDEIIRALHQILGVDATLVGAGRTDSGVHARGQVAGFRTEHDITSVKLFAALNGVLPEDVRIRAVDEVGENFHARFDAKQRRYSYRISLAPTAIERRYSWHVKYALDLNVMKTVAPQIVGKHDFSAFCKNEAEVENRVCTVVRSEWVSSDELLTYTIAADRFVHGMVRAIVGTMVDIGRGYTPVEKFAEIMASHDRSAAGTAAPARGLCLEEVLY
jgi:tRNA pseudouridine38-40 synthase